jgi:hypothetical protein
VVEPSKHKALSSNLISLKKERKEKGRKGRREGGRKEGREREKGPLSKKILIFLTLK